MDEEGQAEAHWKFAKKTLSADERSRREAMYRAEIGYLVSQLDGEKGSEKAKEIP